MCFVTHVLGMSLETLRPSGRKTFAVSIATRIINVDTLTQVVSCVLNELGDVPSTVIDNYLQAS